MYVLYSDESATEMIRVKGDGNGFIALEPVVSYIGFQIGDILLTPDEARELAEHLRAAAEEVDG